MESFIRTCAAEAVVIWAKTCDGGYIHRRFASSGARMRLRGVTIVTRLGKKDDRIDPSIRRRENVCPIVSACVRKRTHTSILQDGDLGSTIECDPRRIFNT